MLAHMFVYVLAYHIQPIKNTVCVTFKFFTFENRVDPDQLASNEASWSGSTSFSIHILNQCDHML